MHASKEIGFSVKALPVNPQPTCDAQPVGLDDRPLTRYSVDLLVQTKDVKLARTSDSNYEGQLRIDLVAWDRYGDGHKKFWKELGIDLRPESYAAAESAGIPAHFEIDLPESAVFLEAGVYDWNAGKVGTVEVSLR
jgi:hypothetical protein